MDNKKCAQISGWGIARKRLSNGGPLKGNQAKLDADGDGKITGRDFKLLKSKNKKQVKKTKPSPRMKAMGMA